MHFKADHLFLENKYLAYSKSNTIWITDTTNLLSLTQPLIWTYDN